MKVAVIGGGISGLCTSYYLLKAGVQVELFEPHKPNKENKKEVPFGASYVNAGYLTPSHIIPLSSPSLFASGLKMMFQRKSPFYIKPRLSANLIKWGFNFAKHSNNKHVDYAIPEIAQINLYSKELFQEILSSNEIGDFQYRDRGLLMIYKTKEVGDEELEVSHRASEFGIKSELLEHEALKKIEPHIHPSVLGAVRYYSDVSTNPIEFMSKMWAYLMAHQNFNLVENKVEAIDLNRAEVRLYTDSGEGYSFDKVAITTGAQANRLLKSAGDSILLEAGKGYAIQTPKSNHIAFPALLLESKVAVSPFKDIIRFSGTMELSGINHNINKLRVSAIAESAEQYYQGLSVNDFKLDKVRCGLRPLSPDGLPYIGVSKDPRIVVNTGGAMMGWSIGPAAGKMTTAVLLEQKTEISLSPFVLNRF
tara:strand:+ start:15362 stop:16624 length:1263 start_codon:yes stop_codon:yes gene_type:complete